MFRSLRARRMTSLALLPGLTLVSCRATRVNEHDSQGLAPSVQVRARWDSGKGHHLVGGLLCQLVQKVEGQEPRLAASLTTTHESPLLFSDLEPGRYRLVIRGAGEEKLSEEFELRPGRRVTVRVAVKAAAGDGFKDVGEALAAVGKGALIVAAVVGVVVLVGAIVVGVVLLGDDEEEDEDGEGE